MTAIYKFADIYWNSESSTGYDSYQEAIEQANASLVLPGNVGRLLSVLCDAYPEFVTNRELKQKIWNHEYLSDESVTQLIKRTRDVLKDQNKTILVNTKGKGYRLQVKLVDPETEVESAVAAETQVEVATVASTSKIDKSVYIMGATVVINVLLTLVNLYLVSQ